MIQFELLDTRYNLEESVGFIPNFASEGNPDSLKDQFNKSYSFGGGWNPLPGFTMDGDKIIYPGDSALPPIAKAKFRDQTVYVYPYSWVAIVEQDGSFEVSRMD